MQCDGGVRLAEFPLQLVFGEMCENDGHGVWGREGELQEVDFGAGGSLAREGKDEMGVFACRLYHACEGA